MRQWVLRAVYLLPLLYLVLVLWLQPSGRLGVSGRIPRSDRFFYDDGDWTAIALRTLNAERGRTPGKMIDPCVAKTTRRDPGELFGGQYQPETFYFLEYPISAVWLFRGAFAVTPEIKRAEAAPELLDACHWEVVDHRPVTENELLLWRGFRRVIRIYDVATIVCLIALIFVVCHELGFAPGMPIFLFVLPAAMYFTINRFDVVPALLTTLSLCFLRRKRIAGSAIFLAAGAMVKAYPFLMAPLFLRYLISRPRQVILWTLVFAAAVLAMLSLSAVQVGWIPALVPFRYQLSRSLDAFTIYGPILPVALGGRNWAWFRSGALLVTIGWMMWAPVTDLVAVLRRSVVVLIVFISLQVFFSPQWILWLLPLLVPLAGINRALIPFMVALDLIMYLSFPVVWDHPYLQGYGEIVRPALLYARFVVLAILVYLLVRWDRGSALRRDQESSAPEIFTRAL